MKQKQMKGIYAAVCTPMDAQGKTIEIGRFRAHLDELIDAGVHGLVLGSGTGEYAYLSSEERQLVISEGCKHVNGRVPTIAQTTALSTADCIDGSKFAQDAGASALMIMPSFLEPPNERGVMYHYTAIAKSVRIPIVMYNVPAQAAPISSGLYRKLIAVDNLDYIKDSSGDFHGLQKLVAIGGGVFNGADHYVPYSLMEGCIGVIWGAVNVMPHECVQLYELIAAGKHAEALALWAKMKALCIWLSGNRHDVDYLTAVKAAARLTGRDLGGARKPLPPVPGAARHDIKLAMSKLPINRTKVERLVWRDWQEEHDWLVQSQSHI